MTTKKQNDQKNKVRVQFDLSPEGVKQVDRLVNDLDYASRAEAIRKAVKVCNYILKKKKAGRKSIKIEDLLL